MNWFTKLFNHNSSRKPSEVAPKSSANPTAKPHQNFAPLIECQLNLTTEQLKKFAPLRDLDEHTIATIHHTTVLYPQDTIIFTRGSTADYVYYLLEGRLAMQPDSAYAYEVTADTSLAALPLNSGKQYGSTATTLTDATILKLSTDINRLWANKTEQDLSCVELVDIELPEAINDNRFFNSFAQAYRENKLCLPSLPNVAFKLKQAMQQDIGINEAVEIIQIDPPIVAKLIQVANSPLYASVTSANNCFDAVNRIGLNATRNLVLSISLKQLFKAKDQQLMKGMQKFWKNSLYVSSLSFVLAKECSNINPEDALLAGLICDIGAIPLLHFAENFPEQYPHISELEASLAFLRGPVGSLVLHTLGFSAELSNIPHQAENWLYDSGEQLSLADIVLIAKLHSYFGSQNNKGLPYINSIPAYAKINQGQLDANFSLTLLHKAQSRVKAAMQMLS